MGVESQKTQVDKNINSTQLTADFLKLAEKDKQALGKTLENIDVLNNLYGDYMEKFFANQMEKYLFAEIGKKYKMWADTLNHKNATDCSWLLQKPAKMLGIDDMPRTADWLMDESDNVGEIADVKKWDLLFAVKWKKANHVEYITGTEQKDWVWYVKTIWASEARWKNGKKGVQEREYKITTDKKWNYKRANMAYWGEKRDKRTIKFGRFNWSEKAKKNLDNFLA